MDKVDYTKELTAEICAEYEANPSRETVDAIALRIGKSARSVIAKLSSEKVYQTPVRVSKTGDAIIKKEELVADIERWLGVKAETLAKSGKQDLLRVHKALKDKYDTVHD